MFEPASPDTFGYLVLGLGTILALVVLYIGSLIVRTRNLEQDLHTLESLENEQ
jgi:hypothetical protein